MLNFLALGDWGRRGTPAQRDIARQMSRVARSIEADFVISTGDNFYEDGVASIHDDHWQVSFNGVYTAPSLDIDWYSVLGNHDHRGSIQAEIDYTSINSRWCMPGRYYSTVHHLNAHAHARLIFLDTTPFIEEYQNPISEPYISDEEAARTEQQCQWLDDTLSQSNAVWNIVVGHHPIFSSSPLHGDSRELARTVLPILRQHEVQVYLCGHDHNLQHLKPPGDIHHFISGAASETRDIYERDINCFARDCSGFMSASITPDYLHVRFFDSAGATIHTTLIERHNPSTYLSLDLSEKVPHIPDTLPKKWADLRTVG